MATKKAQAQSSSGRDFQTELNTRVAAISAATSASDKIDANDSLSDLLQEWIDDIEQQNKSLRLEEDKEHLNKGDEFAKSLGYDSFAEYAQRMGFGAASKSAATKQAETSGGRAPVIPRYVYNDNGKLDYFMGGRPQFKSWLPKTADGKIDEAAAKKFELTPEQRAPFEKARADWYAANGKQGAAKPKSSTAAPRDAVPAMGDGDK